jgi:hypothetical protein
MTIKERIRLEKLNKTIQRFWGVIETLQDTLSITRLERDQACSFVNSVVGLPEMLERNRNEYPEFYEFMSKRKKNDEG